MASVTQVLDLKDNQMQWVLNHIRETMDFHEIHYRPPVRFVIKEKILILQDQDVVFGNGHNNFLSRAQRDVELFDIDIQGGGDQFSKTKFFLLRS